MPRLIPLKGERPWKNRLPHKIVDRVFTNSDRDIKISKLASHVGMSLSGLWFKLENKRKWDAENWLYVMAAMGLVKYEKGNLIIRCKLEKYEWKELEKLSTTAKFVV